MPNKRNPEPFLQRQLKKLVINTEQLQMAVETDAGNYTKTHLWSLLKLVFLSYSSYIYSNIMGRHGYYSDKYYYIDLFAGSGIGRIIDSGNSELVFGSPLLTATTRKFNKMFFFEKDAVSRNALSGRLNALGVNNNTYELYGDCNSDIDKILPKIKNGHSLIFIDPWSTELDWKTMEKILALDADIIFNLQSAELARGIIQQGELTSSAKSFFRDPETVRKLFSDSDANKPELILNMYASDILKFRKDIDSKKRTYRETKVFRIKIKGTTSYFYDLLFITRLTANKSPWLAGLASAAKEINDINPKMVDLALDVLSGKQKTLDSRLFS